MAYNGFLLKIGDYTIDGKKYIRADSYSPYMNIQDLDSYRDANGDLHRTALDHVACKIEFETPAMLTNKEFATLMSNIRRNYVVAKERKVLANFYLPEFDDYYSQYMYIADPKPKIYGVFDNVIYYDPISFSLIAYGSKLE
jgi:hypothetical protein